MGLCGLLLSLLWARLQDLRSIILQARNRALAADNSNLRQERDRSNKSAGILREELATMSTNREREQLLVKQLEQDLISRRVPLQLYYICK